MKLFRSVANDRWAEPLGDDGAIKAQLFNDFRVDPNGISVWAGSPKLAARIMSSSLDQMKTVTLLEIPEPLVTGLGILVESSPTSVPDPASTQSHKCIKCFSGPLLLLRLLELLSGSPICHRFSTDDVGKLLVDSLNAGLAMDMLKTRTMCELMMKQLVPEEEVLVTLRDHLREHPRNIAKLRVGHLRRLVDAGVVPFETAKVIHPGISADSATRSNHTVS